jgi:IclR family mhp operon transcriptional activator
MAPRSEKVEAAARTLRLLEELNRHRMASLHTLHLATQVPKSTISRLLKSLILLGYVANDHRQGGYTVTSRVKLLSYGFHGDPLVVEAARPWVIAFTRQHQWPVAIAILDGTAVAVRFSTVPDSPVSPFHGTINSRLSLLGRALGRAHIAFCPPAERSKLLDKLAASDRPEDLFAREREQVLAMLSSTRCQGFAERDPRVEPRSSGSIAVPIMIDDQVLATVGMTYFKSAVSQRDVTTRYAPLVLSLGENIAKSISALR